MSLEKMRRQIDKVDEEILCLINQRARIAVQIGKIKNESNKGIYVPSRETAVYGKLKKKNKGPLSFPALKSIYRQIMASSLNLEKNLVISYFGPRGSYTHSAAMEKFGVQARYDGAKTINDCFVEVAKGRADYGVVPVENSSEGVVNHTLDMFVDSDLRVMAEIFLDISHNLLSRNGLKKIAKIYSNPQAIAQCRNWLQTNMPGARLIEVSSTSEGARRAARDKTGAAIAGRLAAEIYGLKIAAQRIEDVRENVTRFLVIGKNSSEPSGEDKTSVMFSVKDQPGALYRMLKPFALSGINLTKIESRPSRKKAWEYIFFVDLEGHIEEDKVARAIKRLEDNCKYLKVLGSYPKG